MPEYGAFQIEIRSLDKKKTKKDHLKDEIK